MLSDGLITGNGYHLVVVVGESHVVDSLSVLGLVLEYLLLWVRGGEAGHRLVCRNG